jgi:hypothetical protein
MAVVSTTCDVGQPTYDWQSLVPQIRKLVNCACENNMIEIISKFKGLGFPWEGSDMLLSFANLITTASGNHGFYGECYAKIIFALCENCGSQEQEQQLLAAVEDSLSKHMCKFGFELCANTDPQLTPKLKRRLVNTCCFAGNIAVGTSKVSFLSEALRCLGVLCNASSPQSFCRDSGIEEKTRVAMLSGACPKTQPVDGETLLQYTDRLACELGMPSQSLSLLAGDTLLPTDLCLDHVDGKLQLIIHRLTMPEEYRVEAIHTLFTKAMPHFRASNLGEDLIRQVFSHLDDIEDELPKRAKFMLMDMRSAYAIE